MMKKIYFIFSLIIILAFLLRFFYLGKIPDGLYSDEAAYGYNAYSILLTGKDEYGNFLPVAFKSFGDYKAPLYIYYLVPFIAIFGLNIFSLRLSTAVLGVAMVILTYILTKKITGKKNLALLSSFITGVLPFALQFNRMAHENNLVAVLISAALLFFIFSVKSTNFIYLSAVFFAGSIYTYHDAKVFTPLMILCLLSLYNKSIILEWKKYIASLFLFFILLVPFISSFTNKTFWSRPSHTIIFSDPGRLSAINEARGEDINENFVVPQLFHNKFISFTQKFIENYGEHFSYDFLFSQGDPVKIYQTIGNGLLYFIFLPFFILGIYYIWRINLAHKWLIILWFILAPIPSALTRFVPSASRLMIILPPLVIFIASGFVLINEQLKCSKLKRVYFVIISLLFSLNMLYYLHYYYVHTPYKYAKEWHYGMKEVMDQVSLLEKGYTRVWFSRNAWGYIYPLFYLKYPPEKYHPQADLSGLNEYGFGWIEKFDRYVFADLPADLREKSDILFVGAPEDFSAIHKPLYTVYYPDKKVAFYIADSTSF